MGVVVVTVLVTVIVGQVEGDRSLMAGCIEVGMVGAHRPHSGRGRRPASDG